MANKSSDYVSDAHPIFVLSKNGAEASPNSLRLPRVLIPAFSDVQRDVEKGKAFTDWTLLPTSQPQLAIDYAGLKMGLHGYGQATFPDSLAELGDLYLSFVDKCPLFAAAVAEKFSERVENTSVRDLAALFEGRLNCLHIHAILDTFYEVAWTTPALVRLTQAILLTQQQHYGISMLKMLPSTASRPDNPALPYWSRDKATLLMEEAGFANFPREGPVELCREWLRKFELKWR